MSLIKSEIRKYSDIKEVIIITKEGTEHKVPATECIIICSKDGK